MASDLDAVNWFQGDPLSIREPSTVVATVLLEGYVQVYDRVAKRFFKYREDDTVFSDSERDRVIFTTLKQYLRPATLLDPYTYLTKGMAAVRQVFSLGEHLPETVCSALTKIRRKGKNATLETVLDAAYPVKEDNHSTNALATNRETVFVLAHELGYYQNPNRPRYSPSKDTKTQNKLFAALEAMTQAKRVGLEKTAAVAQIAFLIEEAPKLYANAQTPVDVLYGIATSYQVLGKDADAAPYFARTLQTQPNHEDARFHLDNILIRMYNTAVDLTWEDATRTEGITLLEEMRALDPHLGEVHRMLGKAHEWNKEYAAAREAYKLALAAPRFWNEERRQECSQKII